MITLFLKMLIKLPKYARAINALIVGLEKARADGTITVNEAAQIIVECLQILGWYNIELYDSPEPLIEKEYKN